MNDAAALHVEPRAEARQRSDGEHLVALDDAVVADLDAVLEHDPRGDDDRALAEPHAFADRCAGTAVRVAALVRGERPEGIRVGAQRLEEASIEPPFGLGQLEHGGQADALERDAGEEPGCVGRHIRLAATSRSTSSAVMKPSFSMDARSMPCSSASSTARRVAFAGPAGSAGAAFAGRANSAAASSASLSATSAMRPPSSTSSPCA